MTSLCNTENLLTLKMYLKYETLSIYCVCAMCNTSIIELSAAKKSYISSEWVVVEIPSTWNVWFMPHASVGGIHLRRVDTTLVVGSISKSTV